MENTHIYKYTNMQTHIYHTYTHTRACVYVYG